MQHALARPDHSSCIVQVCTFCVIFCGLRFSHILMIVLCMHLVHVLHVYLLRLALQCHAFIYKGVVWFPDSTNPSADRFQFRAGGRRSGDFCHVFVLEWNV